LSNQSSNRELISLLSIDGAEDIHLGKLLGIVDDQGNDVE
jgi:hypothetical protein